MEENEDRFLKLGFIPQRENVYNKLLPYSDKLDEESNKLFHDIKTNLIKAVIARELRPGCAVWTSRLNKYMKIYGFKFSKEDHICLIKLYYELLMIPNLEPTRVNKFAGTLAFLLKKIYLIPPEDLQLEWRPLYDLCIRLLQKSKFRIGMYRYFTTLETTLDALVRSARHYFPASATQEILDEFRPMLDPLSSSDINNAIEYLEVLLPMVMKPEEAHIGYKLWFEEFMNLLEVCNNASAWENRMVGIMACLSLHQIGRINWEPYVQIMFVRFIRALQLPVGYRQKQSGKHHKIEVTSITTWIVSALGGPTDTVFVHLEKFMHTLESYFHSANAGRWTAKIRDFLKKISFSFVNRVHAERYQDEESWHIDIPESHRLTDADIDRFVLLLKPCLKHAVYSRQFTDVNLCFNYLSALRPNIIIPLVLDKLYASMDSLTEPHKLTSAMMAVTAVSRYMVQGSRVNYPEGPTHVIPLLMNLLPGIDPNDLRKCFMTFNFIVQFVNMVPLLDSSDASTYHELTEEEHTVCEATATFEDFVMQFFDRLYSWVESSSLEATRMEDTNHESMKSRTESLSETALVSVISTVLTQCSPQIFTAALKKNFNFVTTRIFELKISGKMISLICQSFGKINPVETSKLYIPHLCDTLENLLDENVDILKEEDLDGEFMYNLLILSEVVELKSNVMPYMDRLLNILDRILFMTSTNGGQLAGRMLNVLMMSLSFTTPIEARSSFVPYDTHIKNNLSVREWGSAGNVENLKINWYMPGKPEIEVIQMLLNRYLVPALDKLDQYAKAEITLDREKLRRTFKIILAVLGCHTVLPLWEEPAINLVESEIDPWGFELIVGSPHIVSMPDGRNVRKVIADAVHNVQKRLLEIDEGDTKSIFSIICIYDVLLFNKFRGRDFEYHWKTFHMLKKIMEDRLHRKKMHLRHILIDRAMLHQELRNESRSCSFTATHKQILLDLFELSVSRYSSVRFQAQSKFFGAIQTFPYSYTIVTPHIKEILQMNSTEHHERFKGCLYLLCGPKSTPLVARHDWNFVREIWPLLIKSMPSEKQSIIALMFNVSETVHRYFPTIALNQEVPDGCIEAAKNLAANQPVVDVLAFNLSGYDSVSVLQKKCDANMVSYTETVDMLLDVCINGNLHWRYFSMAICLLRDLVHPDMKYNSNVVKFILKGLIHDSIIIRKLCLKIVLFILKQNKPTYKKITIDPYSFSETKDNTALQPGQRPDNKWLLYDSQTFPNSAEEWDKPRFVHNSYTGFYCWPKKLETFAASSEQPYVMKDLDSMNDQLKEVFNFFNDNSNMETLIIYLAMEEKKGNDKFNPIRLFVFKNLFKIYEDKMYEIFFPHLEKLVRDTQEQSQRCAAEIISGIIRGCKHWNYEKTVNLWSSLIPLIRTAFNNISVETANDWVASLTKGIENRDPNRYNWLLEFLMDNPLNESSSFLGCTRLFFVMSVINQQGWRNAELKTRMLEYCKDHLTHQFQNVRDQISTALSSIFNADMVFPGGNVTNAPRVKDFFAEVMPKIDEFYKSSLMNLEHSKSCDNNKTIDAATNHLNQINLNDDTDKEVSIRLFKVVAKYVTGSIVRGNYSVVPDHYRLLPLACVLQSNDTDDEVGVVCSNLIAMLAHTFILEKYVPFALEAIRKVSLCPFWSARAVIAEFIPVLVFHNMATIFPNKEWVEQIQGIALKLLEDEQPEVRMKASHILSGFLHTKFIPDPTGLLELFKKKAKTKLRLKSANGSTNGGTSTIKIRHAGVLGLCSYISAHPYDVPEYLPSIFGELGPHLNDPPPIPATIRKTLGDFKRTHHSSWDTHKLQFTDDELSVLSDLTVPPSYYA